MLPRLLQRTTSGRLSGAVFWSGFGLAGAQGLSVLAGVLTARLLGREAYGEFGMVTSTLFNAAGLAGAGLATLATRQVAESRASDPGRAGAVAAFSLRWAWISGLVLSAVVFFGAEWLAETVLSRASLEGPLRVASLLGAATTVLTVQLGLLSGLERFVPSSHLQLLRGLLALVGGVGGAWWGGLTGASAGIAAGYVLGALAGVVVTRSQSKEAGIPLVSGPVGRDVLVHVALPAMLANVLVGPVLWLGNALLARAPDGYAEIALINATQQWRTALLFVPTVLSQVGLSVLSSAAAVPPGTDARAEWTRLLSLTHGLGLLAAFPIGSFFICAGDGLLLLYGRDFRGGHAVLAAMLGAVLVQSVTGALGPALQSQGRFWFGFAVNVGFAIVFLGGTALLAEGWGALGFGVALALGYVPSTLLVLWALRRELPEGFIRRSLLALVLALVLPFLLAMMSPVARWVLAVPLSIALAFLVVQVLVQPSFREALKARIARFRAPDEGVPP